MNKSLIGQYVSNCDVSKIMEKFYQYLVEQCFAYIYKLLTHSVAYLLIIIISNLRSELWQWHIVVHVRILTLLMHMCGCKYAFVAFEIATTQFDLICQVGRASPAAGRWDERCDRWTRLTHADAKCGSVTCLLPNVPHRINSTATYMCTYILTYIPSGDGARDGISYTNSIKIDISLLVGAMRSRGGQDAYTYTIYLYIYVICKYICKSANED